MNIEGKSFLVTGGAGFIGSKVVGELLKEDVAKVIVYDNFVRGSLGNLKDFMSDDRLCIFPDGGDIREVDVLNRALTGVDGVFHLAAMWLLHCLEYPRTAFDVNILGTYNVLEACINQGVKRIVYSSSASVYGDAETVPMTESHPLNNRNFYGATKIASESILRATYHRYGLEFLALRYMNVYGPNQEITAAYSGVIPNLFMKLSAGETAFVNGDGTQAYDFIEVTDIARANILAMKSSKTDLFLNIGTGVQTSIAKLCEIICEVGGFQRNYEFKPYSSEDARRLVQNRIGSTELAEKSIDFKFSIPLREGLSMFRHSLNL